MRGYAVRGIQTSSRRSGCAVQPDIKFYFLNLISIRQAILLFDVLFQEFAVIVS